MKMNKLIRLIVLAFALSMPISIWGAMRLHLSKRENIHEKEEDTETLLKVLKQP